MRTITERRFDFSGGVQSASSWLLRAQNEIEDVTNGRFNDEIGRIARRLGYAAVGSVVVSGKPGLGLFEAKFSTGAVIFAATNKSDDSATEVRKRNNDGTWTLLSMPTALAPNTEINMCTSLDSAYIAGKSSSTGARMKIVNVKNDLTLSETRNLIGAPKARFICEYGGRLHAINVELGGTVYPDRDYISSPALSVITFTRSVTTLADNSLLVDSARYLKAGMAIDIYNHVTGVARYTNLTIASVDKATDAIVLPANPNNLTFVAANVNTATDVITLASTANYPTGTPVTITSSGGTIPAGLSLATVYYVINTGGTTIKLATTAANATAGTAVDITSTGSGTMTANLSYVTADNDEIYLTGRYGELYYLWNTDYPTADKADFLKIPSGASSNSEIIGYAKSNNRLFLYTDTTLHRYDQSQLIPIFEDIGVANHQTIRNVGDWLIWLDNDKRVVARNDATGQMEFISRSIKKKYLKDVPLANLANAAAGAIDNIYKLSLGTVDGKALRVVYDFDSNNWSRDEYIREFRRHIVSSAVGSTKSMYILTDNGKFVQDEIGNDDDGDAIPLVIKYGRNHYGTAAEKNLVGMYVFGENMAGGEVRIYRNGDKQSPEVIGKLTDNISLITPGQRDITGRDLNIEIAITGQGDPPAVDGHETHLTAQEDKFDGTK